MTDIGNNRLPALAAEIKAAHLGVMDAAKTAAERAIDAGRALIEAKALMKHGQWLAWLKDHCQLAERTAQLYMRIAESGLESATVADMGLKAAAGAFVIRDDAYDVWHGIDAAAVRQWRLFVIFGVHPGHVEWLRNKQFVAPDEWLGAEGAKWRRVWGMNEASPEFLASWARFQAERAATPNDVIEASFNRACSAFAESDLKQMARRRRRRTA